MRIFLRNLADRNLKRVANAVVPLLKWMDKRSASFVGESGEEREDLLNVERGVDKNQITPLCLAFPLRERGGSSVREREREREVNMRGKSNASVY